MAEAQACLSKAVAPTIWPADPPADREALRSLALGCQRFTPLVGLEDASEPSALLLDITGCAHLFGGERSLFQAVRQWVSNQGYAARWALADTTGAAWALARHGRQSTLIPPGRHDSLLSDLSVAALRLPASVVSHLRSLGLRTVGDVARLPRACLPGRFGPELVRRWDQAFGRLPEGFTVERLVEPIAAAREFEEPLTHRLAVDAVSDAVLDALLASPRLVAAGPRELRGTFRLETGVVGIDLRLVEPSRDVRHLGQLARLRLDQTEWSGGVVEVRWEVVHAGPLPLHQREFFETGQSDAAAHALRQLVDRLSSRMGRDRVLRVQRVPDPQPECSVVTEPWRPALPRDCSTHEASPPLPPHCRPIRLLKRPQRLSVWSVIPDGPPYRVGWKGRTHDITQAWGPERIETGWWRAPDVKRDYYRVEIATGAQWWLFRERTSGEWFLHGFFE